MKTPLALIILFFSTLFQSLIGYELSIGAIFQNEEPYLKEWIEYHRLVGVEHFWLFNDSTSNDKALEILQPYIDEGIVELTLWTSPSPLFDIHIDNQCKAYREAIKRSTGKTKWIAFIDLDEYLLPLKNKTITECLKNHFAHAAGIYVNWRNFGTSNVNIPEGMPTLFYLSLCSLPSHSRNCVGKSIVRPECVDLPAHWHVHFCNLIPNAAYYNGDAKPLLFKGRELVLDGKSHTKYLRINHYSFRDENFFRNVKLPRIRNWGLNEYEFFDLLDDFSKDQDFTIMLYIMNYHPDAYKKFWKPI